MEIPIIFGIQGTKLSKEEADFFRNTKPFGFILFTRNLENPDQVRKLINDLKNFVLILKKSPFLSMKKEGRYKDFHKPSGKKGLQPKNLA